MIPEGTGDSTRTATRSWSRPTHNGTPAATNKRHFKRQTALPGEIERSIIHFDRLQQRLAREEAEAEANDADAQRTPNGDRKTTPDADREEDGDTHHRATPEAGDRTDDHGEALVDLTMMSAERTFTVPTARNENDVRTSTLALVAKGNDVRTRTLDLVAKGFLIGKLAVAVMPLFVLFFCVS